MQDLYSWIGFIIFWAAAVLGLLGLLLATAVVCGWHVFGHRVLTDADYELQQARIERVYEAHRWLAPFHDLDPIWDHIFYGGDVARMRERLAKERGVTVYNEPLTSDLQPHRQQCPMWIRPDGSDSILACSKDEGHDGPHAAGVDGYSEDQFQHMWVDHDTAAAGTWWGKDRKNS